MQKMFEYGNTSQKVGLSQKLQGHVLKFSTHVYGCWIIQKAVEFLNNGGEKARDAIIAEIREHIVTLVTDQNGIN